MFNFRRPFWYFLCDIFFNERFCAERGTKVSPAISGDGYVCAIKDVGCLFKFVLADNEPGFSSIWEISVIRAHSCQVIPTISEV